MKKKPKGYRLINVEGKLYFWRYINGRALIIDAESGKNIFNSRNIESFCKSYYSDYYGERDTLVTPKAIELIIKDKTHWIPS